MPEVFIDQHLPFEGLLNVWIIMNIEHTALNKTEFLYTGVSIPVEGR